MFYEELVIDGKLCWRGTPNGDWVECTQEQLTKRLEELGFPLFCGKWKPIETAPKDGKNFIGLTEYGVEVVRWCDWNGREYSPADGWIGVEQDSTCLPPNYRREKAQHQPTHWMPLPTPPSDV